MPYRHYSLPSLRAGLSAIAMVVMATAIAACSNSQAEAPPPPPEVDAAQIVTKSVRQWDEFTGRIAAIGAVDIRPRVSGYIDRIAFKEGDMIKAGDLLFVIDPRPYRASYDAAVAQLERARASTQLAEAQNKRAESLIKTGAISIDTYDTRSAALGQTNADVHAAEAALSTAKLNLDFTEVRSPIAGRVSRALLTLGNLVQADQTVLTSVVSQNPVHVYFQPDEQSFLRYRELARKGERANSDNPVRVGLASETGFPHSGTVNFVNNQVDAATGTINVRATVPNPDGVFVPGLYARVQLEGRAEYIAMLIDDKAIMTDQDRKYVYVLGTEDKAKRKDIMLGSVHDGLRVVQSGLDANDKVIVAGLQKIFAPDTKVKPNLVAMSIRPQS
ncbi:efflux RND transporter periplasmic adaptor subunit [Bradyrhizobium sp. AZCC 2230]|uniref:efflux RND transporter periplasmic adaptor subunit n=1 Tax=Bradyrhizobium sp. AZCC 2230 TaxID=3117021 RepID=UPI002FF25BB6